MTVVVTGCAGFIGSTLVERLLEQGRRVIGVDALRDYYDPQRKLRNLESALTNPNFSWLKTDIRDPSTDSAFAAAETIYHLAAQPGVRKSWAEGFNIYLQDNVDATQHLLEQVRRSNPMVRIIYASSSSVYGDNETFPTREDQATSPVSPYGVTKLAAEHLTRLYHRNYGIRGAALRYHTVYGPRQRPDMAIFRLIEAGILQIPFPLYAAPATERDFTFVDDIVEATIRAAAPELPDYATINISSGRPVAFKDLLAKVEHILGREIMLDDQGPQKGDVLRTGADITVARELLAWQPSVSLDLGLARQVSWMRDLFA